MAWSESCKAATCCIFVAATFLTMFLVLLYSSPKTKNTLCEMESELFHEETGKCYKSGEQGPCSDTLVLSEQEDYSHYGGCSCAYKENDRTLLYHNETNQCYFIFSQAFCEDGFWLNVTKHGEPFCSENYCANYNPKSKGEIVPLKNGKCAFLNRKAESCAGNEVVSFYKNSIYPSCRRTKFLGASLSVPNYPCPLGSFRNIMGKCQPHIDVDLS